MRLYAFLFALISGALLIMGCPARLPEMAAYVPEAGDYDVVIHRDEYGVPHIYGETDADVAYGVAFAQCEDDFETMEEMLASVRGALSRLHRMDGLMNDFAVRAFRVREFVAEKYDTEVSPEVRALCEAYADGFNHYVALNPGEVTAPYLYPAVPQDIIAGFTLRMPFFYMLHQHLRGVLDPRAQAPQVAGARGASSLMGNTERGSNTFAVAPSRSADGYTRLAINSHQPWTGPVAWYEARLKSEEGLDITGGIFPGAPVILHGHNRHLGWAHTVNRPDLCDIYELTLNPENPDQYEFDGEWLDFEKQETTIQLRLWGPLTLPVKRELLWSVHGPAVINARGAFAIRFIGYGEVGALGQFYAMNKATNFDEWYAAMATQGYFCMNAGYADREGNIFYLYNAKFPMRAEGYDWTGIVPGNTSETLWTTYWPFEKNPQVLNPASGFIQNCNNDPFHTTAGPENPRPEDFPEWLGITPEMTNRAHRALELFGSDDSITREEFDTYKWDRAYSKNSLIGDLHAKVLALDTADNTLFAEALDLIREWDFTTEPESVGTALFVLTGEPVVRAIMFGNKPPALEDSLRSAIDYLMTHHGRLDVPWGEVNRLVRGEVNVGLGGGPDVLNAVYGDRAGDGTIHGHSGDCYINLVEWDPQGRVSSRSLHQFGSASTRPESPHYADQVPLFVNRQLKPVHFEEEDLMAHVKESYRPGERGQ
jgi:penicillin amidase/acyl-homoserine-lactone acylase